jgi:glycosyltransferase involved in cell wall biosynthesis
MTTQNTPLVSIGMPVRNGGRFLVETLESLLSQTYQNFEIIISDNHSTDETKEICKSIIAKDGRIRYVMPSEPLSAFQNFEFVLSHANGPFFMWASHDDLRSADSIEHLLKKLQSDPQAILSFGRVIEFETTPENGVDRHYQFETKGIPVSSRIVSAAMNQCFHIYGLWKTERLRVIPFYPCFFWPDKPILLAATTLGDFVTEEKAIFYYRLIHKTDLERVQYQENRSTLPRFYRLQLLWVSVRSVMRCGGLLASMVALLAMSRFIVENWYVCGGKMKLYGWYVHFTPSCIQRLYKNLKLYFINHK